MTWISNAICRGLSLCSVSYGGLEMIVRFVDIDGIGDLSLLKFLFIILVYMIQTAEKTKNMHAFFYNYQ